MTQITRVDYSVTKDQDGWYIYKLQYDKDDNLVFQSIAAGPFQYEADAWLEKKRRGW